MLITHTFILEVKFVFSLKIKFHLICREYLPSLLFSAGVCVVYKSPDAISASLQLKSQNSIRTCRQTHRGRRMGNECSWPLQILQDYTFLKVIFLYWTVNIWTVHGYKYEPTKLYHVSGGFRILANSVTILGLTVKLRKNSASSSTCIFSTFYFPVPFNSFS